MHQVHWMVVLLMCTCTSVTVGQSMPCSATSTTISSPAYVGSACTAISYSDVTFSGNTFNISIGTMPKTASSLTVSLTSCAINGAILIIDAGTWWPEGSPSVTLTVSNLSSSGSGNTAFLVQGAFPPNSAITITGMSLSGYSPLVAQNSQNTGFQKNMVVRNIVLVHSTFLVSQSTFTIPDVRFQGMSIENFFNITQGSSFNVTGCSCAQGSTAIPFYAYFTVSGPNSVFTVMSNNVKGHQSALEFHQLIDVYDGATLTISSNTVGFTPCQTTNCSYGALDMEGVNAWDGGTFRCENNTGTAIVLRQVLMSSGAVAYIQNNAVTSSPIEGFMADTFQTINAVLYREHDLVQHRRQHSHKRHHVGSGGRYIHRKKHSIGGPNQFYHDVQHHALPSELSAHVQ